MPPDSKSNAALLGHIIAQTQSNIDFLVSQNYLRASDAATILSKLSSLQLDAEPSSQIVNAAYKAPTVNINGNADADERNANANGNPVLSVAERMRQLSTSGSERDREVERAPSPPKAVMPNAVRRVIPPPPAPRVLQAKALWDYNADGSDPNDLSFHAGDVIEIISETNADWWTGRLNGRQGLFPSNYVEKLPNNSLSSPSPSRSVSPGRSPAPIPVPEPSFPSYSSPPPGPGPIPGPVRVPSYHSTPPGPYGPPSWQAPQSYGYNNTNNEKQNQMYAPPPPSGPPVQQAPPGPPAAPAAEPEKKKNKFGGLGQTMATSAAGGVGFGAGAAIGSGIINSIF